MPAVRSDRLTGPSLTRTVRIQVRGHLVLECVTASDRSANRSPYDPLLALGSHRPGTLALVHMPPTSAPLWRGKRLLSPSDAIVCCDKEEEEARQRRAFWLLSVAGARALACTCSSPPSSRRSPPRTSKNTLRIPVICRIESSRGPVQPRRAPCKHRVLACTGNERARCELGGCRFRSARQCRLLEFKLTVPPCPLPCGLVGAMGQGSSQVMKFEEGKKKRCLEIRGARKAPLICRYIALFPRKERLTPHTPGILGRACRVTACWYYPAVLVARRQIPPHEVLHGDDQ